ncbi:hypothetical protein ALC53_09739, partial [Atta colombica]
RAAKLSAHTTVTTQIDFGRVPNSTLASIGFSPAGNQAESSAGHITCGGHVGRRQLLASRGKRAPPGRIERGWVGEGCSLRAEVGREERGLETGGLITSHTDAVHCRGDSALAYSEAHVDIYACLHAYVEVCVCESVRERTCLFRTC